MPAEFEIDWPYVAGFLDGEGCFKIYRGYPRITIGQKNREVLDLIQEFWGTDRAITLSNGCYYLQINSKNQIEWICKKLLPYVIVKQKDIELILEHWDPEARGV